MSKRNAPGVSVGQDRGAGRLAHRDIVTHKANVRNPRTRQRVGRLVEWRGERIFVRPVVESKHRLRMRGGAWGLEVELIDHLQVLGAQWVVLLTDRSRELCAPLEWFRDRGFRIEYGHGPQLALKERQFLGKIRPEAVTPTLPGLEM